MSGTSINPRMSGAWWRVGIAVLLGGALYVNTLWNPFVYDDLRTVVENGSIVSLRDVRTIVLYEPMRPLTNLTLAIDRAIWGPDPFGFHLANVALHALNIALVFVLGMRLWSDTATRTGSDTPAPETAGFMAALIFAAHPIMSEAVGYISSRSDLLCASFFLLAFLCGRRWWLANRSRDLAAAVVCWSLAFMAKETAILLPVVLGLWVHLATTPTGPRRISRPVTIVLLLMLAAAVGRTLIFVGVEGGRLGNVSTLAGGTLLACWMYVRILFLAGGQAIFHAPPNVSLLSALLAAAGFSSALVVMWGLRCRVPLLLFGAGWFLVLLVPAALPLLSDTGSAVAEHRAYLPVAGFAVASAGAASALAGVTGRFRSTRILAPVAFAALVLMCGGRTYLRNAIWSVPVSLWEEAARLSPSHWIPVSVLGETLHREGRHYEAAAAFRRSVVLRPDGESATIDLAVCLVETGRREEAERVIDAYEHLRPDTAAGALGRGAIAALMGQPDEARALFNRAIERDPNNVAARQWLVILAEQRNDHDEALGRCYEIQRLSPGLRSMNECITRSLAAR